jgi:hypothetical protein
VGVSWEASSAAGSVSSASAPGKREQQLTVSHGKVDVEHSHKLGVSLNDFPNAFTSECLLPESSLDLVQDLLVAGLSLVEH